MWYRIIFAINLLFSFYSFGQKQVSTVVGDTNSQAYILIKIEVSDSVRIILDGPSESWFAIGFNTNRMAIGTDVVLVPALVSDSTLLPYDSYITGYGPPKKDRQDWVIQTIQLHGKRTMTKMVRALKGESEKDFDFTPYFNQVNNLDIIWAIGPSKNFSPDYHGRVKGSRKLIFTN